MLPFLEIGDALLVLLFEGGLLMDGGVSEQARAVLSIHTPIKTNPSRTPTHNTHAARGEEDGEEARVLHDAPREGEALAAGGGEPDLGGQEAVWILFEGRGQEEEGAAQGTGAERKHTHRAS